MAAEVRLGHEEALDLAAAALDGSIDAGAAAALDGHLAACPDCAAATTAMRRDAAALGDLPRHDAPERIRQVVVTSMVARSRSLRWWQQGIAAVSIATILVVGLLLVAAVPPSVPQASDAPRTYVWGEELPAPPVGSSLTLTALAGDGSTTVALGSGPAGTGAWRSLGSTWQAEPSAGFRGAQVAAAMGTAHGFVAVGYAVGADGASDAVSWTSADGTTWTRSPASPNLERTAMADVTAGPGGFLAVGLQSQPEAAAAWWSSDGLHWLADPAPEGAAGARVNALTRGGSTYVAVGQDAAGAAIWWSHDGETFRRLALAAAAGTRLLDVAAGGPGFVAVGWTVDASQVQHAAVWTSVDGLSWQVDPDESALPGVQLDEVTAWAGRLTAVGTAPAGAVAYVSLDGVSWQALPAGPGFSGAAFRAAIVDHGGLLVAGRGSSGPGLWRLQRPSARAGP
ncbi:MAG: zf-HC2 domain-containing protein [Candidatus Limnocylindrales bacterium]